MTTPSKYSPNSNVLPPRCPHCAADLTVISKFQWSAQIAIGMTIIFAVYCPNAECRKVLGTQIMLVPAAEEKESLLS